MTDANNGTPDQQSPLWYVFAWTLAIALGAAEIFHARFAYEDSKPAGHPQRRIDGNPGHTAIDFGGQWIMGRMLTTGHGRELYHRSWQWAIADRGFPRSREAPSAGDHDPAKLLGWSMGYDDPAWAEAAAGVLAPTAGSEPFGQAALALAGSQAWSPERIDQIQHPRSPSQGIGGALYPPLHAFLMAPLALDDEPQRAYFTAQWIQLALAFLSGLGVSWMTHGRIWWPVASALILVYPGFRGSIDLGQNSATTLCILVWGWALIARGRPLAGGLVWGFLAYKPVWAMSFFLALPLLRQWRAAIAMAASGALLILATLPFVGLQTWFDWLAVGREAAAKYNVDLNWISLSRDLFGIPRRFFIDFARPYHERENPLASMFSWALWLLVLEITLRIVALRPKGSMPLTGPIPAFILFGAWLCTYRFIYYDVLASALPVCVMFAHPRAFFIPRPANGHPDARLAGDEWTNSSAAMTTDHGGRSVWLMNSFPLSVIACLVVLENVLAPLKIEMTAELGYVRSLAPEEERASIRPPKVIIGSGDYYPWDTLGVILLWGWCGLRVLSCNCDRGARAPDTS